jgi:hypothetical protein
MEMQVFPHAFPIVQCLQHPSRSHAAAVDGIARAPPMPRAIPQVTASQTRFIESSPVPPLVGRSERI